MRGKCIEEFEVGQVDESRARTITETDVVTFSWVSGDVNPMHTDAEHSARSPIGQRIAHGALGLSIATGLSAGLAYLEGGPWRPGAPHGPAQSARRSRAERPHDHHGPHPGRSRGRREQGLNLTIRSNTCHCH